MVDARIEKTRAALAAALLELLGQRDFASITIGELAAQAGIGYATFFRHYKDKEELLGDAAEQLIDDLLPRMLPALRDLDTRAAGVALCRFVCERRNVCRAFFAGGAEPHVRRLLTERSIARSRETDLPDPPGLPLELATAHSVRATMGLLAWWLDEETGLDAEAMGAIIDRLVLSPVHRAQD